ncbi:lipid IV(A) 3-deoxy-D-manno-octulosonic acid transferase [Malikia sp.]|uniref:lipid IV(A) 3-deoxy-D-manno-octulosonic acid transferase n=1 Tax=Malikia sp. TaxID=2070706 RepID=UPI0026208296|nr:lipid IV(A) 3-deoxy-D-manno-octulosonic acid transferase [Malikia sp.]MDD2728071.1 lipid IV(A) 3-deoxy-D-manno-octulosonic acid transferase [Malikia sp.]
MTRLLYTALLLLLTPLALLRLWLRGKGNPDYRKRWGERLGFVPVLPERKRLWVHAVSVGETVAAAPLVRAWRSTHPDWAVLVTTTTPTGSAQVRRMFGDNVEHCYLPFDLPWMVGMFLRRCRPSLGVVMETEIWPNLYAGAQRRDLPLIMANARLSDKSFKAYRRLRWLVGPTLQRVALIGARGREDAERFVTLGASAHQVEALGNLKFDLERSPQVVAAGQAWRDWLGQGRPVWIAASTHPGEEEQILAAHRLLLEQQPQALLVLAPRHPERAEAVLAAIQATGLQAVRRSALAPAPELPSPGSSAPGNGTVLVVDTLGELMTFYAASDIAYVGGSLVPNGGHNPLEPLVLGLPVLSGPQVFNFREVYAELQVLDAVTMVESADALGRALGAAFSLGLHAPAANPAVAGWMRQNQGSTARLIERAQRLAGLSA